MLKGITLKFGGLLGFVLMLGAILVVQTPSQAQYLGINWVGEYYDNTSLSGTPVAKDISYRNGLQFNWGKNSPTDDSVIPIPHVPADNFSAIFTSTQQFDAIGTYTFHVAMNDGVRVYLDDQLYLDQFTPFNNSGPNTYQVFSFEYTQMVARAVNIRVEYVEFLDDANLVLSWSEPQETKELLINRSFETTAWTSNIPHGWIINQASGDKRACPPAKGNILYGACAFKFTGSTTDASKLVQVIDLTGHTFKAGDTLEVSAFFKGNHLSAKVKITLFVYYTGNEIPTKTNYVVRRNKGYIKHTLPIYTLMSKSIDVIKLQFSHQSSGGVVWLDDVSVLHHVSATAMILSLPDPHE